MLHLLSVLSLAWLPDRLRVERLLPQDAFGIDTPTPILSWDLQPATDTKNTERGPAVVSAFTIYTSRTEQALAHHPVGAAAEAGSWSETSLTKQVATDSQHTAITPVVYGGAALQSSTKYWWKVCVSLLDVASPSCSAPSSFVTGIMPGDSWAGKWIGGASARVPVPCTPCMAAYHSWCPKEPANVTTRCGFGGIQLKGPSAQLGKDQVASAIVHVTGLGMYELYLNGDKVGDAVLDPGFSTNFTERLLYTTYDVTKMLLSTTSEAPSPSSVTLAARIGSGKYSLGFNPPRYAFIAELHITYVGGKQATVMSTDSSWTMSNSPIAFENLYQGEIYDARLEVPNWSTGAAAAATTTIPTAANANWSPAHEIPKPISGQLSAQLMPTIKIIQEVTPVAVTAISSGNQHVWRFSLGKNIAGVAKMRLFSGVAAGTTVTLQYGEILDSSGNLSNPFTQVDKYVYSGKEADGSYWTPTFVYHGFYYVDVEGLPAHIDCKSSSCLTGIMLNTALEKTGSIEFNGSGSSTARTTMASTLNAIHTSVVQTQLSNMHSVPTDCPTREKRGWMGDGQWTAEEASLNFDSHAIHMNWVNTMIDVQDHGCFPTNEQFSLEPPYGTCCSKTLDPLHPTIFQCSPMSNSSDTAGSVPDVVPMLWGTGGGRGFPGAPVWGTAIIVIPDVIRSRYQDTAFLKAAYPNFKAYMSFLKRQAKFAPGKELPQFGLLGDWLSLDPLCPGGSDKCLKIPGWISGNPTTAFYYLVCVEAMSQIASDIGNAADAASYAAEFKSGLASYHAVFFNATTGDYGRQQTANTMPLYIGAVPPELLSSVADALVNNIKAFPSASDGGHVSVGGVGSRWILQALTAANRTSEALALATQTTQPSWGYFATTPPYTFWEHWEQQSGSFNHIMLGGGVDVWIYHQIAGIRPPSTRTVRPFQQQQHDNVATSSSSSSPSSGATPAHIGGRVRANTVEFGVEGVVIEGVRACAGSVSVRGGRASSSWSWDTKAQRLDYNTSTPFASTSTLALPRQVGGRRLERVIGLGSGGVGSSSTNAIVLWSNSDDDHNASPRKSVNGGNSVTVSKQYSSEAALVLEVHVAADNNFAAHYSL